MCTVNPRYKGLIEGEDVRYRGCRLQTSERVFTEVHHSIHSQYTHTHTNNGGTHDVVT
jgi:hypothetical protein